MNKNLAPVIALGVSAAALTGFSASSADAAGFRSCDQVRAAGIKTPIPFGAPGYSSNLDRDDDGWACEPPGVTLPDPRKAHKPAPAKSTPAKPVPTKPAPVVGAPKPPTTSPSVPSKPAAPKPAPSSGTTAGPVVQTDLESQDNAEGSLAVLAGLTLAAGAGAWGLRRRLEQH